MYGKTSPTHIAKPSMLLDAFSRYIYTGRKAFPTGVVGTTFRLSGSGPHLHQRLSSLRDSLPVMATLLTVLQMKVKTNNTQKPSASWFAGAHLRTEAEQEGCEFEASLGCTAKPCFKSQKPNPPKK